MPESLGYTGETGKTQPLGSAQREKLSRAPKILGDTWAQHLSLPTFARASSASRAGRKHRGPPESPFQVVVLLGQLLQCLLQPNPLIPLLLQRLLPLLPVRLRQEHEIPAGLQGNSAQHGSGGFSHCGTLRMETHVDHGVGGDAEERGPLVDLLDLVGAVGREAQGLELAEGALQGRAVLGNQVVAGAQVLHFAG